MLMLVMTISSADGSWLPTIVYGSLSPRRFLLAGLPILFEIGGFLLLLTFTEEDTIEESIDLCSG